MKTRQQRYRLFSLEELLLLEVEPLEEVRLGDKLVPDGLVEVQEHEGHVLPNFLLDLADPLGVVLAVLNHAEVGLEGELNLLEDLLGRVVARLTIDGQEDGGVH